MLELAGLTRSDAFSDVDLCLHRGEILGLAGMVGAGRSELAQAIAGVCPAETGTIRIDGKKQNIGCVSDAIDMGIAYVPEDRQHQGLVLGMSVADNITLAVLEDLSRGLFLSEQAQVAFARRWQEDLQIQSANPRAPARHLSGGNQQKCLLAKWLATKPRLLIVDEPTRGIDVGAKAEIHALLGELVTQGVAIIMISSDLPEVLAMSDRIIVLHEGRIATEIPRDEANEEHILRAATGMV